MKKLILALSVLFTVLFVSCEKPYLEPTGDCLTCSEVIYTYSDGKLVDAVYKYSYKFCDGAVPFEDPVEVQEGDLVRVYKLECSQNNN